MKKILTLFLLLPPIVFSFVCYWLSREDVFITELGVPPKMFIGGNLSTNRPETVKSLAEEIYSTQVNDNQYPIKIEDAVKTAEANFTEVLRKRLVEEINWLAEAPIYVVCIYNNNKLYLHDNEIYPEDNSGTLALDQKGGYKFNVGIKSKVECKNVSISKFKNAPSRIDFVLMYAFEKPTEMMDGNQMPYKIASTTLDMSESKLEIGFPWWMVIIFYLPFLLTWSIIFFQLEKIGLFIIGNGFNKRF